MSLSLADKQKGFISYKITGFSVKECINSKHQEKELACVELIERFVQKGKVKLVANWPIKPEPTTPVPSPTPQVFS